MSRISKEIFRKIPLSSVILPYYSNPMSARKMMLKLCKGSRSVWLKNNSQWSNLLTHLRTKTEIQCNKNARKHVKYLAKIAPFVELHFSIYHYNKKDVTFVKNLVNLIENKSLKKFKVKISDNDRYISNWEFEDDIKSILYLIGLISEIDEQYEINIAGKKIQVTELPDFITLENKAIFGENKWIVCGDAARFVRLLGEYTQICKELGVGDLDSSILRKIKSPDRIYEFISNLRDSCNSHECILSKYIDYSIQSLDCFKVLQLAYADNLYINNLNQNSQRVKPLLTKMRSLKSITFEIFKEISEAITQLGLQELQRNGVKINLYSSNHPFNKYKFTITADECIVLHAHKEIEALNIKAKGDVVIDVYSLDFTYIINNEYLLWNWYSIEKFEIDWELIESKQKVWFPKFANKLKGKNKYNFLLIPLNRIKQVSYRAYLSSKDIMPDNIKFLTNELNKEVCKPLFQSSSLFCLFNEETKIDI